MEIWEEGPIFTSPEPFLDLVDQITNRFDAEPQIKYIVFWTYIVNVAFSVSKSVIFIIEYYFPSYKMFY